ncbi:hypothetical protein KKD80_00025 [Patescibacteria group bacterium]|nr:hypothetical protein [Patescibacteria group bacterium]
MAQKLSDFLKTASRTSYVKSSVKQAVSKMGLNPSRQVSERQAKEVLGKLKKSGAIKTYRSPTEIFRETERARLAANKDEKPKITVESLREERKAEEEKKKRMRGMMSNIYGQERAREEEKEKGDGKVKRNVATSALKPKAAPGRAETTTSILRSQKNAEKKTAPEEKPPQAIDLPID